MISIVKWLLVSYVVLSTENRALDSLTTRTPLSRSPLLVSLLLCMAALVVVVTKVGYRLIIECLSVKDVSLGHKYESSTFCV